MSWADLVWVQCGFELDLVYYTKEKLKLASLACYTVFGRLGRQKELRLLTKNTQILTIWPFAKTIFTNEQLPKLISNLTLLLNAKSCGAELRHLNATSAGAECRATADGRLSQRANVHLAPCYLALRCLSSTPHDLALSKRVRFKISFGSGSFVKKKFLQRVKLSKFVPKITGVYMSICVYIMFCKNKEKKNSETPVSLFSFRWRQSPKNTRWSRCIILKRKKYTEGPSTCHWNKKTSSNRKTRYIGSLNYSHPRFFGGFDPGFGLRDGWVSVGPTWALHVSVPRHLSFTFSLSSLLGSFFHAPHIALALRSARLTTKTSK